VAEHHHLPEHRERDNGSKYEVRIVREWPFVGSMKKTTITELSGTPCVQSVQCKAICESSQPREMRANLRNDGNFKIGSALRGVREECRDVRGTHAGPRTQGHTRRDTHAGTRTNSATDSCTDRYSSQFENNYFTEM